MKKIMFNDNFLLTKAVLEGRKTQTRRIVSQSLIDKYEEWYDDVCSIAMPSGSTIETLRDWLLRKHTRYRVGEMVAVAQSYKTIYNEEGLETMDMLIQGLKNSEGWNNKMFVRSSDMSHQIRITDVRVERLQAISAEDCLKEGLEWDAKAQKYYAGYVKGTEKKNWLDNTPREAFARLINKVSRKDVWQENPYVFVYDFELIK